MANPIIIDGVELQPWELARKAWEWYLRYPDKTKHPLVWGLSSVGKAEFFIGWICLIVADYTLASHFNALQGEQESLIRNVRYAGIPKWFLRGEQVPEGWTPEAEKEPPDANQEPEKSDYSDGVEWARDHAFWKRSQKKGGGA